MCKFGWNQTITVGGVAIFRNVDGGQKDRGIRSSGLRPDEPTKTAAFPRPD
jgi:hypothetical protein